MRENMASHLQSSTEGHLALACVKLNNTQEQLANTQVELNKTQIQLNNTQTQLGNTQTQLNNSQETTVELVRKVDWLERQLKEKLNEKQVNEAVHKVMQMKTRFIWKIDNFSEMLRRAKSETFHRERFKIKSEPFYTHSCGYKLQLSLYPNGNGSGTNSHLSVYNNVLKGEYDALLPWPVKITTQITLIDQQPCETLQNNVESRITNTLSERPKSGDRNYRGSSQFLSQDKLMTRCYLQHDTLFLQVDVGPTAGELGFWPTPYPLLTETYGSW